MNAHEQILVSLGSLHAKVDAINSTVDEVRVEAKEVNSRVTVLEHDKTAARTLMGVGGTLAGVIGGIIAKYFPTS